MRKWRRIAAAGTLLILVGATGAVAWRTRAEAVRLLHNPMATRRVPTETPINYGMVFDDVAVLAGDGTRLVGWYVPTTNGAVVMAQHGYKASRGEMLNEAAMLHRRGYGVLIMALRAHDLSDGELISFGRKELEDLDTWYRFATEQPGVDRRRIGALGNSLGGTLMLQFAARTHGVAAIVAQSAFSSLRDTIDTSVRFFTGMPPFPFAPMIAFWAEREAGMKVDDVDAKRAIARISPRPVLLMQGGADVVISTDSGQRLYDAAGEPKELWFEPSLGHSRFDVARPDEYERRVSGFFDRYLPRS